MTFRTKLMLAMGPLVLALLAVGVVAGLVANVLARQPGHIWKDNYRSVLAAQRMKESLERCNEAAYLDVLGGGGAAARTAEHLDRFEREMAVEADNITEPGEAEAVVKLRTSWAAYRAGLRRFVAAATPDERRTLCFGELARAFASVKSAAEEILYINQDAVVRKGQRTERRAEHFERLLFVAVLLASVLGLLASVSLTTRLLRPLGVVSAAVRRFGQGDTQARAQLQGEDDIAHLAQEFNAMADHLERYRRSSLGDLLQAQQGSQAAIDSLPDPVLLLDAAGSLLGINVAARQQLHIDPEERGNASLAHLDLGVRSLLDRLRAHVGGGHGAYSPKGFEDAIRIATGAGESIYLPRATPIYGEGRSVSGAAIVFQDITRLFRFDELKNNLVATVAHEFRTPLTSLRMAIHMCTEEAVGPLTAKQADLLLPPARTASACRSSSMTCSTCRVWSRGASTYARGGWRCKPWSIRPWTCTAPSPNRNASPSAPRSTRVCRRSLPIPTGCSWCLPTSWPTPSATHPRAVRSWCGRCPSRKPPVPRQRPAASTPSSASRSATRVPASHPSIKRRSSRSSFASPAARKAAPASGCSSPVASCKRTAAASASTASRARAPPSGSAYRPRPPRPPARAP
jgi:signal transduction histidine kinase